MRKTRKKNKLEMDQISSCHPGQKQHPSRKQCLPSSVYSEWKQKEYLSSDADLFKKYGCQPGEEHCLLDHIPVEDTIKKGLRKQYLRPKRPKTWDNDPDMWLDNYNIAHVMKQYEEAYPWFTFVGVFPIDFSAPDPYVKTEQPKCLYTELCNLNLVEEYKKGKRGIGIIFNLDPHFKGGSHWVGLYINLMKKNKPIASYFDSYGYETPPLIARLMRSFKLQVHTCELGYNARRFQYGHSECGMFSMYFIICMMHGITFKDFCKDAVNDRTMLELRKILFTK
jgi:hypothetical protein